jgi:excisionase family DNA binding protein
MDVNHDTGCSTGATQQRREQHRRGSAARYVGRFSRPRILLLRASQVSQQVRLLTLAQAGERVQLSRWTLRRAIERGELEGFCFGRRIRVSEEALEAWIRDGVIEPSAPSKQRSRRSKPAPNYFRQIAKEVFSP